MADQAPTYHVANLFDWTKGVMDKSDNPLAVFENSLSLARDVDISGYGLRARQGSSTFTTLEQGSMVRFISGIHLPTPRTGYLIAMIQDASGFSRIFAARLANDLSVSSPEWIGIHDLGHDADTISVACLNDRVVITEGKTQPPLVFAGCLDPEGSDWAVPRAVMVTYNDGRDWNDISDAVCDSDPETAGHVEPLTSQGWIAICCDTPKVNAFHFDLSHNVPNAGALLVEGYTNTWESAGVWSDSTYGLTASGFVTRPNGPFTAAYHSLNNVPGFWFRIRFPSTFNGCDITRLLFQCPCQPLSVIGDGLSQAPLGFLYYDASDNSLKDFSVEVSDYTYPTFARLNNGALDNPTGMQSSDSIFVGYINRFSAVELTLHNDFCNALPSIMNGSYWNGTVWAPLQAFSDNTSGPTGATLASSGMVSWTIPSDWMHNRPVNQQQPHGYWIRLAVSSGLTAKTYITEASVIPVMDNLKKTRFAMTVRDRVVLLARSDAPDQIDISRPLEEYGFSGQESASFRIGGQGEITAAVEVFNQGFIAKSDDWYLLNGYSPSTFSVERAEAAGQTPINSRVIVRAPHAESDSKNLMGLYYINRTGAWHFAGLKVYRISENISWWDESAKGNPRIDNTALNSACGVYMPDRNQVIWAVPMKGEGLTPNGQNNSLIVYDLDTRAWSGPHSVAISAMSVVSSPSGASTLIGASCDGNIMRLLDPESSTDGPDVINAQAQTQWLNFNSPHIVKRLSNITLHAKTGGSRVEMDIFCDGGSIPETSIVFDGVASTPERGFMSQRRSCDAQGRFFRFLLKFLAPSCVYGFQVGFSPVREWSPN